MVWPRFSGPFLLASSPPPRADGSAGSDRELRAGAMVIGIRCSSLPAPISWHGVQGGRVTSVASHESSALPLGPGASFLKRCNFRHAEIDGSLRAVALSQHRTLDVATQPKTGLHLGI